MAFTPEDLAQLGQYIDSKITAAVSTGKQDAPRNVGVPETDPEAGPEFWVHLADGTVVQSYDSQSTHMESDGLTVPVIGRYQIPRG
jgi:hypothetical protein